MHGASCCIFRAFSPHTRLSGDSRTGDNRDIRNTQIVYDICELLFPQLDHDISCYYSLPLFFTSILLKKT
jgi:hypothetical protein